MFEIQLISVGNGNAEPLLRSASLPQSLSTEEMSPLSANRDCSATDLALVRRVTFLSPPRG